MACASHRSYLLRKGGRALISKPRSPMNKAALLEEMKTMKKSSGQSGGGNK
jgi:hypothetical protein